MTTKYTPPSIKAVGLANWINNGYTLDKWQCSYTDFVEYRYKLKLSKRKMCELFGKPGRPLAPQTMAYWWQIDDEERG